MNIWTLLIFVITELFEWPQEKEVLDLGLHFFIISN